MSWLSNGVHAVTKAVSDTGHAVGSVASNPWVQGITAAALAATGVGAPAAAAILAAQKGGGALLKKGGNIGQGVTGAATGAVEGYGAAKAGSAIRGAMGSGLNADGSPMSALDRLKALASGGGADGKGSLGSLGDIAGSVLGGGGGSGLDKLLAGGSIAAAAADKLRQQGLQDKAINYATSGYDAKAPLRAKAIAQLQDTTTPDLSSMFSNKGNVYDAQRRGTLQPMAPSAASQMTQGNALTDAVANRVRAAQQPA